jgi:hypothetical protein
VSTFAVRGCVPECSHGLVLDPYSTRSSRGKICGNVFGWPVIEMCHRDLSGAAEHRGSCSTGRSGC